MNWTKNLCAFTIASAVGMGALAAAPATALQAPYVPQAKTTVTTTNPAVGATLGMSGTNFGSNETVVIRIKSKPRTLAKVETNRKGKWSAQVKLPKRYKCGHTLVARGKESGKVTRTWIVIGKRSNCS